MNSTLVFLEYLETGLIPVRDFQASSIEEFDDFLNCLSPEEKRSSTRKFRKIFREIAKEEISKSKNPEIAKNHFVRTYGYTLKEPSKYQLRARRRLVHNSFLKKFRFQSRGKN